jgi:hypothetical protein
MFLDVVDPVLLTIAGMSTIVVPIDPSSDLPNAENQSVRAAVIGSEVGDFAVSCGLARAVAMAYEKGR